MICSYLVPKSCFNIISVAYERQNNGLRGLVGWQHRGDVFAYMSIAKAVFLMLKHKLLSAVTKWCSRSGSHAFMKTKFCAFLVLHCLLVQQWKRDCETVRESHRGEKQEWQTVFRSEIYQWTRQWRNVTKQWHKGIHWWCKSEVLGICPLCYALFLLATDSNEPCKLKCACRIGSS